MALSFQRDERGKKEHRAAIGARRTKHQREIRKNTRVEDDWHVLAPVSLSLMNEDDKPDITNAFANTWRAYETSGRNVIMKIVKEQIGGSNKFTYRAYVNVPPTVPAYRAERPPRRPEVVAVYKKYLLVKDPLVSQSLETPDPAALQIEELEDEQEKEVALLHASAENMKDFATGVNRTFFGAVNPDQIKEGEGDRFYATCVFLRSLPIYLDIPVLTGAELGYDVLTLTGLGVPNKPMFMLFKLDRDLQVAAGMLGAETRWGVQAQVVHKLVHELDTNRTALHRVSAVYTFYGKDIATLERKVKDFVVRMRMYGVEVDWIPHVQALLYEKGMPKLFHKKSQLVSTTTFNAFYPYRSAEILEFGGASIYVGTNRQTGSPVFIDIARHLNKNMTFIGMPRAGKSMFFKLIITRLDVVMATKPAYVITDPSSNQEYRQVSATLGIEYKTLTEGAGIDPLAEFDAPTAAGILADLFQLDRYEADYLLTATSAFKARFGGSGRCRMDALPDFVDSFKAEQPDIADKLAALNVSLRSGLAKYGHIFKGDRPKGSFALSCYTLDEKAKTAACTLAMAYAIKYFHSLPPSQLKIFALDEGWSIFSSDTAQAKFSFLSRDMGKHNTAVIFITQDPSDVADKEAGAIHIKNSSFKFLFKNDGVDALKTMLGLSEAAVEAVKPSKTAIRPGMMLCMIDEVQALVQVDATPEEYEKFNTSPDVQL